jgi:capsular polysaccharide biosynthesis protein
MELRQYWQIVWKRIWIPVLLIGVVLVVSVGLRRSPPPQYHGAVRVLVDMPPLATEQGMNFDPRLTAPQATEYLVDDFSLFVTGQVVADAVSQKLAGQGIQVPAGVLQSSTTSEKVHRVVTIQITWSDPQQAAAILKATVEVLREQAPIYFSRLEMKGPQITLFDGPNVGVVPASLSQLLDLPVRLVLAAVAGIALCFLLDYLDDSLRGREDLEALGISVLAEVPGQQKWLGR